MFDVRVAPQRTRHGLPSSVARTIEVATQLVTNPESPLESVRMAHLALDDELASVIRAVASRPGVRLVLRPCVDGAYVVIEAADAAPRQSPSRQSGESWVRRLLGWTDGENR